MSRRSSSLRERYGPWAVVTGASDGIGRAIALALAEAGVHVVLVARRQPQLEALARELSAGYGVQTQVTALDLAIAGQVEALIDRTSHLDVGLLVASAGFGTSGSFVDAPLARELEMIDVNCRAVVALSHAFARRFSARGRGGLVLMSSVVAFQGVPRAATYAATKAFIQTFAEGLRQELAPHRVDVLAAAPGPVHSGFAERAAMTMARALPPDVVARGTLAALGRVGAVRPGWLSKMLGGSLMLLPRIRTRPGDGLGHGRDDEPRRGRRQIGVGGRVIPAATSNRVVWMTAVLHLAIGAAFLLGLTVAAQPIAGVHPALKPAKFGISIALFLGTMAIVVPTLAIADIWKQVLSWTLAATMAIEMIPIALQPARGTTSHFNVEGPLDAALWYAMVASIVAATGVIAAVALSATLGTMRNPAGHPLDPYWRWHGEPRSGFCS